jgi:hypothetical protein
MQRIKGGAELEVLSGRHFVYTVALDNPTAVINLAAAGR